MYLFSDYLPFKLIICYYIAIKLMQWKEQNI